MGSLLVGIYVDPKALTSTRIPALLYNFLSELLMAASVVPNTESVPKKYVGFSHMFAMSSAPISLQKAKTI